MNVDLRAFAARQSGLVTASQALACGYSRADIRLLTRRKSGGWQLIRRGVYADAERFEAWTLTERAAAGDRASSLTMGMPHSLSHDSAARFHGLPLVLTGDTTLVHVTRAGLNGTRTQYGVKHHLGKRPPQAVLSGPFGYTDLARTVIDLGREHGYLSGLCAADVAARRGVTLEDFHREFARMGHWPHIVRARTAVAQADAGADTPAESLARVALDELGYGIPRTQFPIDLGRSTAWADLLLGSLIVEVDGLVKYADGAQALRDEKLRQHAIERYPVLVLRLMWEDLMPSRRRETLRRLDAAYRHATDRFGTELPAGMEAYASQLAAARHRRIYGTTAPLASELR